MKVKYNRVSTLSQSGDRFTLDTTKYDMVLLDKVSGSVGFKDRLKGKELTKLIDEGKVEELYVEEFSRLGRNTGDVIRTLDWLDENKVNVVVRNIGLHSRTNGKRNPIWKMISSVMSSLYEMEVENIRERTIVGRQVYVQRGGRLGRSLGSKEKEGDFLKKELTQRIIKAIKKGYTIREVSKFVDCSNKTVLKVKKIGIKHGLLQQNKLKHSVKSSTG